MSPRSRLNLVGLEDRTVPAVLDVVNGVLSYTAAPGENNNLAATVVNGRFQLTETGWLAGPAASALVSLTLGPGAVAAGWTVVPPSPAHFGSTASGPVAGVTAADIRLGDGSDSLQFDAFEAPITRLTADGGGDGYDSLNFGSPLIIPYATTTVFPYYPPTVDPTQPGVTTAGDASFAGFSGVA